MLRGLTTALLRGWNATTAMTAAGIPSKCPLFQTARGYPRAVRKRKPEISSHLDDLPPTMLMKKYAKVPDIDKVDEVVKRMLSLEMASKREKVKIKKEQLADKVRRSPNDCGSLEVQIAYLTARIRALQEHLQKHHKDKENRRQMMMVIDRRKLLLKTLRKREYDVFENTCKQLDIEYTFPLPYCRRATRRWVVKKALCIRVFEEVKKQKALEKLKQREVRARAAKDQAVQKEGTPV
ncbi:small ribosomal subunit protein uS15m [Heteronotia binoei]|uniref:small ribosomal subunit protein uS15m n=1 Tax=Heteronotia binoei TaxID=13085 RepID=UPI002931C22D|nr:small ribosomal subunit protein uS15m [Heteronotia binoei]